MDAERIAEMRDRQPIRVVCGHCSEDVSNAPQVQRAERDIHDLLAEVARLTAERDAERSLREEYQIKLAFRSGDISRLRAVIEEARGLHYKIESGDCGECCVVGWPCATVKVLDRGLKGAGE